MTSCYGAKEWTANLPFMRFLKAAADLQQGVCAQYSIVWFSLHGLDYTNVLVFGTNNLAV